MKNIFISSTFRDMHAERDLVQERVLPALRAEARKYGDNVEAIDLRWGVDTSTLETDEGSAKVLKVCLDEIDRSHPYMLIFLGERYGWIPGGKLIEKAVKSRGDKYVTEDFEKSVTALEIEYGALSEQYGDIKHCVVCFREPVTKGMDEETKSIYTEQEEKGIRKLQELKERIRKDLGENGHLITYTATWDETAHTLVDLQADGQPLEEMLTRCYIEMFQQDWKEYEKLSWQEKEQLSFKALMESKLRSFVGREKLLEEYYQKTIHGTGVFVLQGEVGSGKTALMCKMAERLQKEGKPVFTFFSGAGAMSNSAEVLVQQMLYFVENQLGIKEHWEEKKEEHSNKEQLLVKKEKESGYNQCLERLRKLCSMLQEKVYFCIDALDQLFQDEHVEKLDFLLGNKNVQMILSCTDSFVISSVVVLEIQKISIPPLSIEDAKGVVGGILKSNSRDVYAEMEQEILKKKNIGNPLYISLLIQRLNMMDQEELEHLITGEEIKNYSVDLIRHLSEETDEAAVEILKDAVDKISTEKGELQEALNFLAVSRSGLRISDLQGLFECRKEEFSILDFTLLMKYLDGFFYIGEEDKINVTHKVIRQGLLKKIKNRNSYETEIKEYLKNLDENDGLRMQEGMYYARITEDYEFASKILKQVYDTEPDILVRESKKEAAHDGGKFYSELLLSCGMEQTKIRNLFLGNWLGTFALAQKEMEANLKISKTVAVCLKSLYEKQKTEQNLRDMSGIHKKVGDILLDQGRSKEALPYYETALHYVEMLFEEKDLRNEYSNEKYIIFDCIGNTLRDLERSEEALPYYKEALQYRMEKYQSGERSEKILRKLCNSHGNIGDVLVDVGRLAEALSNYRNAVKYAEEIDIEYKSVIGQQEMYKSCKSMGDYYYDFRRTWDLKEASNYYEKALFYAEKLYEQQKSIKNLYRLSISYHDMGKVIYENGEWEEALLYYKKALYCAENLHERQQSEKSLWNLSVICRKVGSSIREKSKYIFILGDEHPDESLPYYEKAVYCKEELYKRQQSEKSLQELYLIYQEIKELLEGLVKQEDGIVFYNLHKKAAEHQEKALFYQEKARCCLEEIPKRWRIKKSWQELYESAKESGEYAREYGNMEKAFSYYKEALQYKEEMYQRDAGEVNLKGLQEIYSYIGRFLQEIKRWEEALFYYKKAVDLAEKLDEKWESESSGKELLLSYEYVIVNLREMGNIEDSLDYCEKYLDCAEREYTYRKNKESLQRVVRGYNYMGKTFWELGEIEKSCPYYEKIAYCRELLYEEERSESNLYNKVISNYNAGNTFEKLGDFQKALHYIKKAIDLAEELDKKRLCEEQIQELTVVYKKIKYVFRSMGQLEESIPYYKKLLCWMETQYEERKNKKVLPSLVVSYGDMGKLLRELGHIEDSLYYYDKSIQGMKQVHDEKE